MGDGGKWLRALDVLGVHHDIPDGDCLEAKQTQGTLLYLAKNNPKASGADIPTASRLSFILCNLYIPYGAIGTSLFHGFCVTISTTFPSPCQNVT